MNNVATSGPFVDLGSLETLLAVIEALALAIDAKDQRSHTHIRRMDYLSTRLAEMLGMSAGAITALRIAALLHDIGKLAVPEHIMTKPGPLTPDEVKKVRVHPIVGANIIAQVPFPSPVAPLILCHHERWDGRGYPSGLKGEEIPLGARIISVVDFYDALTTHRQYHPAMSHEAAARLLQEQAGRAFDPTVVERFLELVPVDVQLNPESPPPSVLQDIAAAHREIYALYEIAQAMGTSLGVADTMKLISSKLTSLVPFSCCALYLYNDNKDSLRCRFATGTDADIVRRVVVKNGHGVAGWVARNHRPLMNARPTVDFEASDIGPVATKLHSALVCPLISDADVIGALAVYHVEPQFFNEDHMRLLDRVCEQAAPVIVHSVVFDKTQRDSLTDPLTGLSNERGLFTQLTPELARATRLNTEVGLLMLDLDDFKQINDTYGHDAGDVALRVITQVLRSTLTRHDFAARVGGDEFVILLPDASIVKVEETTVSLRKAISTTEFEPIEGIPVTLSASIGGASFPREADSYQALRAIADRRMYEDKARHKKRNGA